MSNLATRLQNNEPNAWSEFAAAYGPKARATAHRMGLQPVDCDDAVQDAMILTMRCIHKFDSSRGEFDGWFYLSIVRKVINTIRARYGKTDTPVSQDSPYNPLAEISKDASDRSAYTLEVLSDALEDIRVGMAEHNYDAFCRQWWDDQPAEQVAAALGMSMSAVYVAKSRGLSMLRAAVA